MINNERELMVKRASDIVSPYVGQTEQNISRLFSEVEAAEAVLVIDQSDRDVIGNDRRRVVDLKLNGFASTTIRSELGPIAGSKLKAVSKRLSTKSGGEVPTKSNMRNILYWKDKRLQ